MNLPKAIEILTFVRQTGQYVCDTEDEEALELLIEAGKLIQKERRDLVSYAGELLPGETEDAGELLPGETEN